MQHVMIEIEPQPQIHEQGTGNQLAAQLTEAIKNRQNFHAEIRIVPTGSLPRFELKGRRFFRLD